MSAKERIVGKNDLEYLTNEFHHIYTLKEYDSVDNGPLKVWNFVFIEDDTPNAFVSELLPNHIFIHTGLFQYTNNIDEVAFILGHEISHLICGHSTRLNNIEFYIKSIEILLLSIDPSFGYITLLIVAALATLSEIIQNNFSKDHENEADQLAIILSSMSCYNPIEGSHFMYRLSTLEQQQNPTRNLITWMDTHPPSISRSKDIFKQYNEIKQQQKQLIQQQQSSRKNNVHNNESIVDNMNVPIFPCSNTEACKAAQQSRILYDLWQSTIRTVNVPKGAVENKVMKK